MKVAVVTGSNKGIGFEIVKGLCKQFDGVVYLTARDTDRGLQAVTQLEKLGLHPKFHQLDINDKKSLETFRDHLQGQNGGLDLLVNNAAIAFKATATESFSVQAEKTIAVNYTSLVSACTILFPLLRPHARVVNVSSSAGHLSCIPGPELREKFASPTLTEAGLTELMQEFVQSAKSGNHKEAGWPNSTYSVSKVGVSALSIIQQRQFLADPRADLVVNAIHPGLVRTDMSSQKGSLSPEQGADAAVYLALLPADVEKPRGAYVWWDRQVVNWFDGPVPPN